METATISFDIAVTDGNLGLAVEIWLDDNRVLHHIHVTTPIHFTHTFADDEQAHQLRIVLSGKKSEHTTIDDQGNIVKDATWHINNIRLDELDVDQLFYDNCRYAHDFNGSKQPLIDSFHGTAGCNGTITLDFSTPIYLWLLENM